MLELQLLLVCVWKLLRRSDWPKRIVLEKIKMNIDNLGIITEISYRKKLEDALKNIKEVLNIDVSKQDYQYPFMLKGAIIGYEGGVVEIKDKFNLDASVEFPDINEEYQKLFPQIEKYINEVRDIFKIIK
jgi:hypothetical protein